MYKYIALLVRREGTSHGEFRERWTSNASLAANIEGVVRYQQVLPTDPKSAEFDGVAELYFETLPDLRAALDSEGPAGEAAASAHENLDSVLAAGERRSFVGEERVWKDDADSTDGLYKHSAFLVRKEGMSHEEFSEHWQETHSPLAATIEGVVRYHTVYPTDPESAAFDGVAELYFETLDALHAALGSEGSRDYDPTREVAASAREDVDNFLAVEERPRLIGRERVVEPGG